MQKFSDTFCYNCNKECRSKRALGYHMQTCLTNTTTSHHSKINFICKQCSLSFNNRYSLMDHITKKVCAAVTTTQVVNLPKENQNQQEKSSKRKQFSTHDNNFSIDNHDNDDDADDECYDDLGLEWHYKCWYCSFICTTLSFYNEHLHASHSNFKRVTFNTNTDSDEESDDEIDKTIDEYDNIDEIDDVEALFTIEQQMYADNENEAVRQILADYDNDERNENYNLPTNQYLTNHGIHVSTSDKRKLSQIQLLELLDNNNAPLYLFDEIMNWTKNSAIINDFDFSIASIPRHRLIKTIIKDNNLNKLLPKIIHYNLPMANQTVRITTHNILHSIYSLLDDVDLMQKKNLIFKQHPLEDPTERLVDLYTDINDGSCYVDAYSIYCTNKNKDVLCPLIFFIDKTHTDAKGNQKIEPIMFTLGIFNKETRNKEKAWRTIGFIPALDQVSNKKLSADKKNNDYHSMLTIVLSPLIRLQSDNGIDYEIDYDDSKIKVTLKIPILFVTGDSEGQDKLVGRKNQYIGINEGAHICRYCDIQYDLIDQPLVLTTMTPIPTKASMIEQYLKDDNKEMLNALGYTHINSNVFHDIKFCDVVHGVNGSVPADLLHTVQHGIYLYLLDGLIGQKKISKKMRDKVKNNEIDVDDHYVYDSDDSAVNILHGEDRSTLNIFNDKECDEVDTLARLIGKQLQHQSDRNLPRTFFMSGITSKKKKQGQEEQGVILVWMFILLSSKKDFYVEAFGGDLIGFNRYSNWLYILERIIMVEQFIKSDEIKKETVQKFKSWILMFLDLFKDIVDRRKGNKMKVLKFHLLTHLADDIMKFGVPSSYNSSVGESNHKGHKKRVKRTQRLSHNFEEQAAVRYVEHLAIRQSLQTVPQNSKVHIEDYSRKEINEYVFAGRNSYYMNGAGIFKHGGKAIQTIAQWPDSKLQERIHTFLKDEILQHVVNGTIPMMTVLKTEDNIYRADPSFKGKPWLDWAYCDWGEANGGLIPVHLQIFIELNFIEDRNITVNGVEIDHLTKSYAVVHMIEEALESSNNSFNRSKLFFQSEKMTSAINNLPLLAVIGVDCISAPCIAINCDPTCLMIEQEGFHTYNFMRSRSTWSEQLVEAIDDSFRSNTCK